MIAFLRENYLFLAFDSGEYAVHHGLNIWTINSPEGEVIDTFDELADDASTDSRRKILGYSRNYGNKLGRVEV